LLQLARLGARELLHPISPRSLRIWVGEVVGDSFDGVGLMVLFAPSIARPPASLSVPSRPLGSAAVTATPTTIGLAETRAHSSKVKLALPTI
jgi:hypothetical protein